MKSFVLLFGPIFVLGLSFTQQSGSRETSRYLHDLFEQEWEYTLRENPTFASSLGDRRYNTSWADNSLSAIQKRHEHNLAVLRELDNIQFEDLSQFDQLNYQLFRRRYETRVEGHQYRWYLLPLDQQGGIQTANQLADGLRFTTLSDYEDWIARLRAFPTYMDQTIALMREGIKLGMVHPRVIMNRIPEQIATQIVERASESLFFKPFEQFPDSLTQEQQRLSAEAKRAIEEHVVPSFRKFQKFFTEEYLPACYDGVGAWQMPRGKEMYAFRARLFTTTELTPQQIHELGQLEVRRIRAKMDEIIQRVEFKGSFEEFLHFLRTDPQFYYTSPQELLDGYLALSKRIDPTLLKLFGRLPTIPYGVKPIPEAIAPDTTTAYYRRPSADGSRAGTYFVNLYRPEVRPKYEMEALSLHEAVPGHHLQIALAMELGELPAFRRFTGYTAFIEGWGLYAESLGEELGFYEDPYSKFGQLTYEMWRAVRLVVDTGIHSKQWTRRQAIDFFKANAAKTEHDIINEIDRYIAWPGQALAYKIGELKIRELRSLAEEELGEQLDIKAFHDVVLSSGALPLDILEKNVRSWIRNIEAQ